MNLQKYVLKPFVLTILLGAIVVACSSDETSEKASPVPEPEPVVEIDNASPNVVSNAVVPNNGSTGVSIETSIIFAFDEPIEVSSVTTASDSTCGATVQLSSNNFASCVPLRSQIYRGNDNRSFTVYPVGNLDYNTKFELKLKKWIQDNAGNYLTNDFIPIVFTTVADSTVSLVDSVTAEFEARLLTAAGYSASRVGRSNNKTLPLTSTQIDAIVNGAKTELASSGLNNSEELSKILESMMTGSLKGMATGRITTSSVRKAALSIVSSELVAILPGREKFYTDNSSVIVSNLLKTGISQLSLTKASTDETPAAMGGVLEGLIGSLGNLGFSETERVNELVPSLLDTTIVTANAVYSNADHTFWESTSQQLSQTFITGMSQWDDWAEMESDWDEHISVGLETIIKDLNQIDGIVPSEAEAMIGKAVNGIWSGYTSLDPTEVATTTTISQTIGKTVLKEARAVSFGVQKLNLEKVVLLTKEETLQVMGGRSDSGTIVTEVTTGILEESSNYSDVDGNSLADLLSGGNTISGVTGYVLTINTAIGSTSDRTPLISFQSLISGTVRDNCTEKSLEANVGTNFINLGTLADDTYSSCALFITDYVGESESVIIPTFTVDTTKPTISSFSISNNTSATVNINLAASDLGSVSKFYISESTSEPTISGAGWLDYPSSFTYEFQNKVAEEKTLYGWVIDQAGNISDVASTTTQLVDTSAPTGLSMSIASGSAYVNSKTVELSVGGTDNFMIEEMLITEFSQSTTPSSSDSRWQNYSTSATYTFQESPLGTKTLYLWLKDNSGNISSLKQSTVIIDLNRPDSSSIVIISETGTDNESTTSQFVDILLKATDNETSIESGISAYYVSENTTAPQSSSSDWKSVTVTKVFEKTLENYQLSEGTGEKIVYAWFKDLAGNVSTVERDNITNKSVPNDGNPVGLIQKSNRFSIKTAKEIYDKIVNNESIILEFLEDDGKERVTELFNALIERVNIRYNDSNYTRQPNVSNDNATLELVGESFVSYSMEDSDVTFVSSTLDSLALNRDNFTASANTTYSIYFTQATANDNISITRYDSDGTKITTSKTTVSLRDNFEPHVALQHSNHNGQDILINASSPQFDNGTAVSGDNSSDPNNLSEMIVEFDADPDNVPSKADKMTDRYYFPKYNLTASLYDKFGFRDLSDNSSLKTTASSAEDLDNSSYSSVSDQRLENSEKTPLLAVNKPGSDSSAFGTTSTGRSDEFYTTADYNAWATTQTIAAGPACSYYSAELSNVTGSFTGNWYPSNSVGTVTPGSSPVNDSDNDNSTVPSSLTGYSITSTFILGGSTSSGNILSGPSGCGTPAQTVYGYERSVKVNLTEPISQITSLSEFSSTMGVLGQSNIPSGELSVNIVSITAVADKDYMNIQLTDWRTIDASKHFTSDNQTVVANTEAEGISKESLMQIVGMYDSDNVSATAGNGRGVVFVDATPALATSLTVADTGSEVRVTISFDQPIQGGRNFRLYGFGGQSNATNSSSIYYEFVPNTNTGQNTVTRRKDDSVLGIEDVFSTSNTDNISSANYSESISGNILTISILDNTTDDFSNFFAALSDNTSTRLSANNNDDPSFYIDYDNVTDLNFNSWNKVEYYDAYLTNGNGPTDNRSNQIGPRLVGVDYLPPKIGPADNSSSNDNVFLMEVTDHGLQIVSAFGTGADNGTDLTGSGLYFDAGPTTTGDVNNSTDNNSTATQNDYPLYRFWNSAGTDAQDNASTNNNTRTRAVITFADGTVLTDANSDGKAYIKGQLDNDNTSLTNQTTTALMRQSAALANGSTTGSPINAGDFSVDNNTKLIIGIPDYTFTTDNTTVDKTSVGETDILVIDGIEVNGIEYVLHLSPPKVEASDTGLTETVSSGSNAYPVLKVYRKVYLDVSLDGMAAENKTNSTDLANPRELTFSFLENIASVSTTYTVGSPTNMTGVDFTKSAAVLSNNQAKISLANPTGTTDSAGRYIGDGAMISLTATDFSGNSNIYSITLKLGHNQELPITNINDIGDINPIHNLIFSTANSSKKALQAP